VTSEGGTRAGDGGPPTGGAWPAAGGWPSADEARSPAAGATTDPITVEPAAPYAAGNATLGERAISINPDDARLLRRTRLRLVMWSGGITLVVLVLLGTALFAAVRASLENDSIAQLRQRATVVGRVYGQLPADTDPSGSPELRASFGGGNSGTVWLIVRPDNAVFAQRTTLDIPGLPIASGVNAVRSGSQEDIRSTMLGDVPVRVLTEPVTVAGATYVIQVVGDRTAEAKTLALLLGILGIGGLLALALAVGGGWIYAERALVPIRESLRRQREFAADASHELRTPLAVIRGNLEYLGRHPDSKVAEMLPAVDDMTAEVDDLTRLVEDLLLLARADSGAIEVALEPVDLADIATTALGALAPLAEERSVHLNLDALPAAVSGDPGRLRQVVTILVDNAIRHSPAGGHVFVGVTPVGREALLRVDDEGPGIRDEDRPHLFERFWRASDAPTGGVGLGLSIAAWIVNRHRGTIDGAMRPDGAGARFEVHLPLAG
jgi:two-component system, OmpR family, sensor histidine kinase CiaH